ncbi:MAG: hypothetical protein PHG18_04515, partial [Bacilli bacterium]|nr:hypothetical protein [Bacilli bacterium]
IIQSIILNMEGLESQSDISLWFFSGIPTLENSPASEWEDYESRLGDLYYDRDTGSVYKFVVNESTYSWELNQDNNLIQAMALTNASIDTSDNQRKVFFNTPTLVYSNGDWWIKEEGLYICQISKNEGIFDENDFIIASRYTLGTIAIKTDNQLKIISGKVTTIEDGIDKIEDRIEDNKYYIDESGQKQLISTATAKFEKNIDGFYVDLKRTGSNLLTGTHFRIMNDWLGQKLILPYVESPTPPVLPAGINYWYCTESSGGYYGPEKGVIYLYENGNWQATGWSRQQLIDAQNTKYDFSVIDNEITRQTALSKVFARMTSPRDDSPESIKWIFHKLTDISVDQEYITLTFNLINNNISSGFANIWLTLYCNEPYTEEETENYKLYEKSIRIRRGDPNKKYELKIPIINQKNVKTVEIGATPPTDITKLWLDEFSDGWGEVKKYDEATSKWINANIEIPVINNNVCWVLIGGYHKRSTLNINNMNSRKVSFAISFNEMEITDKSDIAPEFPSKDTVWGDTVNNLVKIPVFNNQDVFNGNWITLNRSLTVANINYYNWGYEMGVNNSFLFPMGYFELFDIKLEYGNATDWTGDPNEIYGSNFSVTNSGVRFSKGDNSTFFDEDQIKSEYKDETIWEITKDRVFTKKSDTEEHNLNGNVSKMININFGKGDRKVYVSYDEEVN